MKTLKELCDGKPSNAIKAMIEGLRTQSKRPDFKIRMSTFGSQHPNEKVCYGCAATCTLQQLTGINFVADTGRSMIEDTYTRAEVLKVRHKDLDKFEDAIDEFRLCELDPIFAYFGVEKPLIRVHGWSLQTDDWQEQIPEIEKYVKKLIKLGL